MGYRRPHHRRAHTRTNADGSKSYVKECDVKGHNYNGNTDKYYSQMGVAWAIATIMGKYPQKCLKFLKSKNCKLNKTTYKKTLQKIKESFRVSDEIKTEIKNNNLLN